MQTVVLVFMIFASLLCLCTVLMLMRDIIKDIYAHSKGKKEEAKQQPQQAEQPAPAVEPVTQAVVQEVVAQDEVATQSEAVALGDEGDDSISFTAADHQKTLDEKYAELTQQQKDWYDDVLAYALSKDGAKDIKNNRYQEVKLGRTRLVRLLVKRDVVICQLIMQNSNFKNYLNENKISLKPAATVIKVVGEGEVKLVKDSIDIIVAGMAEEKEYKKQLAKQRRRANRQAQKEAN